MTQWKRLDRYCKEAEYFDGAKTHVGLNWSNKESQIATESFIIPGVFWGHEGHISASTIDS